MAPDPVGELNPWAAFRFALAYPGEAHLAWFREFSSDAPASLEELRALYIRLFEAGAPQPRCPLLESHYLQSRPAGETVLENKLFYKHFGLELASSVPADHLLAQLEFLSWLEHCAVETGGPEVARAREDFLSRHLRHWLPRAAELATRGDGECYAAVLALLEECCSPTAAAAPADSDTDPHLPG